MNIINTLYSVISFGTYLRIFFNIIYNENCFLLSFIVLSTVANTLSYSIQAIKLQEVPVLAEQKVETSTHTVLLPSLSEKGHSNTFGLIYAMNVSDLKYLTKINISNIYKQKVVLYINSVEVSSNEVAALRSKK